MKLFSRGCESRQAAYLAVADRLGVDERIALEAHATSCAECADALRNSRPVDVALRGAFAPLGQQRTMIAPGRIRLVVGPRSARPSPAWLRSAGLFGRLAEVSVMVGVTFFVVGSSLEPSPPQSTSAPATHSVLQRYFRAQPPINEIDYVRWLRLGKSNDSPTASDPTGLPAGGLFDVEPVEIVKGQSGSRL